MIRPKAIVVGGEAAPAAATALPAFAEQGHRLAVIGLGWGFSRNVDWPIDLPGSTTWAA